jgi:cytochrome c-type biogenesis protein CcmH/NrfF
MDPLVCKNAFSAGYSDYFSICGQEAVLNYFQAVYFDYHSEIQKTFTVLGSRLNCLDCTDQRIVDVRIAITKRCQRPGWS